MKKVLAILLLATLAISICACKSNGIKLNEDGYLDTIIIEDNNNSYEESDNNIELTTSNIEDYLQIELSDENFDFNPIVGRSGLYALADLIVDIYPTSSGSFENVNISLELSAPDGWRFCDGNYKWTEVYDYPKTKDIQITLRVNGEASCSYQIVSEKLFANSRSTMPSDYSYQITSVSGTLVKN